MQLGTTYVGKAQAQGGAQSVAGYRLISRIAIGPTGEVWNAAAPDGTPAALKFIRLPSGLTDDELQSIDALRTIRHPHLLAVLGAWRTDDGLAIGLELADDSLWDAFGQARAAGAGGMPRDRLLDMLDQVAAAADFLNKRGPEWARLGVAPPGHGDIKPHNILRVDGTIKLADFGLLSRGDGTFSINAGGRCQRAYSAPETFRRVFLPQSDQYSLAVTYCHLRGGRLPFDGDAADLRAGHIMGEPDLSMLPEWERPAVARALDKSPEARWASCRDFLRVLRAAEYPGTSRPLIALPPAMQPLPARLAMPPDEPRSSLGQALVMLILGGAFVVGLALWASVQFGIKLPRLTGAAAPVIPSEVAEAAGIKVEDESGEPESTAIGARDVPAPAPPRLPFKPARELAAREPAAEPEATATVEPTPNPWDVQPGDLVAWNWSDLYPEIPTPEPPAPEPAPAVEDAPDAAAEPTSAPAPVLSIAERFRVLGNELLARGDYARAIAAFESALRDEPDHLRTLVLLGSAHHRARDHNAAAEVLTRALALNPEDPSILNNRGLAYLNLGHLRRALDDFALAIRRQPDDPTTHYNRGLVYSRRNENAGALVDFTEAIRLRPDNPRFYEARAQIFERLDDPDRAAEDRATAARLAATNR